MDEASLSVRLAEFAAALDIGAMPEAVREKVRASLLDWLAAAASGAAHPAAERYVDLARSLGPGPYPIVGRPERASSSFAVFASAALGHITENDDGHRLAVMHPGAVVFPIIAGLAPEMPDNGPAALVAAAVGYEAAVRVGLALGEGHYSIWHTTATAGVFGAAAAAAKLYGLGAARIADALGHAGTQSAGLWQFLEDGCVEAKPLHPAKSCLAGLIAAQAARFGLPGPRHILEGNKGLLAALARPPRPELFLEGLGSDYAVSQTNFKAYPTCGQSHSMIDALAGIMGEEHFQPEEVREIEVRLYAQAARIAANPDPGTLEEAKFSIQFCLAYLLLHGKIPFTGLRVEDTRDRALRALMARVRLVEDAQMSAGFPAARPCEVTVRLLDGRVFSRRNLYRRGDPEAPLSFAEVADKFRELSAEIYSPERQEEIIAFTASLGKARAARPWPSLVPDLGL